MGPYRTPPAPIADDEPVDDDSTDDRALALLLLAIGGVRIIAALVGHEAFRTEATVALLMVAGSIVLLATPR